MNVEDWGPRRVRDNQVRDLVLTSAVESLREQEPFASRLRRPEQTDRRDPETRRRAAIAFLGHSNGGFAAALSARRQDELEPVGAVALVAPAILAPNLVPDGVPSLFLAGTLDGEVPSEFVRGRFTEAPRPKVFVEFIDGDHWAYTDSIAMCGPPGSGNPETSSQVLTSAAASVAEQQAAQRRLAAHFSILFLRKYLRQGDERIPEDLSRDEILLRVPGTKGANLIAEV